MMGVSATPEAERIGLAERIIGHRFADRSLLRQALTHPSASATRDPHAYYERLEFLGDSVLGLIVAEEVFRRVPDLDEGSMTRLKIAVVAGDVLSSVAADLGLSECLILGESELGTGRRGLASALENTYEAITAALYLDGGLEAARAWVLRTLGDRIIAATVEGVAENPKSAVQELLQARGLAPVYRIVGTEGPPHARTFTAEVLVEGRVLGTGSGRSKKEAESAAAAEALGILRDGGAPASTEG